MREIILKTCNDIVNIDFRKTVLLTLYMVSEKLHEIVRIMKFITGDYTRSYTELPGVDAVTTMEEYDNLDKLLRESPTERFKYVSFIIKLFSMFKTQ